MVLKLPFSDFELPLTDDFRYIIDVVFLKHEFKTLIIDLNDLIFIDEEGIASLIYAYNVAVKYNRTLIISSSKNYVKQMIHQKGLQKIIEVQDTTGNAIKTANFYSLVEKKFRIDKKKLEEFFGIPFDRYAGLTLSLIKRFKEAINQFTLAS